jgi:hypothetical protein
MLAFTTRGTAPLRKSGAASLSNTVGAGRGVLFCQLGEACLSVERGRPLISPRAAGTHASSPAPAGDPDALQAPGGLLRLRDEPAEALIHHQPHEARVRVRRPGGVAEGTAPGAELGRGRRLLRVPERRGQPANTQPTPLGQAGGTRPSRLPIADLPTFAERCSNERPRPPAAAAEQAPRIGVCLTTGDFWLES